VVGVEVEDLEKDWDLVVVFGSQTLRYLCAPDSEAAYFVRELEVVLYFARG
jgi:hypothetical protein